MDRLLIERSRLVSLLLADPPWLPLETSGDPALWERLCRELAPVQADRLLDPAWSGSLLDRETAIQKMVEIGMSVGAFQLPGLPVRVTVSLATAMADLQLTMSPLDLTETAHDRLQRVQAILHAAKLFRMEPDRFLQEHEAAQEWILRLSSDPETFREQQRCRIDGKHPEVFARHIRVIRRALAGEVLKQRGVSAARIRIHVDFPTGEAYWAMRADWLQAVEMLIQRAWPVGGDG